MNKMYEYLQEHNYISRNENKNPLRQQELSKERAEAIACKCENIIKEEQQELIEYLKKEIEQLENLPKDEEMTLEANGRLIAYRIILLKIEKE